MIFFQILVALLLVVLITLLWVSFNTSKDPRALEPKHKTDFLTCQLIEKTKHDTFIFKFALPSKLHVLGIEVDNILIYRKIMSIFSQHMKKEEESKEEVKNSYTPIYPINQKGSFDLLIKIYRVNESTSLYERCKITSQLKNMNPGESIYIKGPLTKIIYQGRRIIITMIKKPQSENRKYKRIAMIAGGSGMAPMYQIIQAVANNSRDKTQLILNLANKTEQDILLYTQ